MTSDLDPKPGRIPVLLLKTKSTPTDAYEDLFSTSREVDGNLDFEPVFVPVLQHRFEEDGMRWVGVLFRGGKIGHSPDCAYGGLIFTSQRAVEAFATLVADGKGGMNVRPTHKSYVRMHITLQLL